MLVPAPFGRAVEVFERWTAVRWPRVHAAMTRRPTRTMLLTIATAAVAVGLRSLAFGTLQLNVAAATLKIRDILPLAIVAVTCGELAGLRSLAPRAMGLLLVARALPPQ